MRFSKNGAWAGAVLVALSHLPVAACAQSTQAWRDVSLRWGGAEQSAHQKSLQQRIAIKSGRAHVDSTSGDTPPPPLDVTHLEHLTLSVPTSALLVARAKLEPMPLAPNVWTLEIPAQPNSISYSSQSTDVLQNGQRLPGETQRGQSSEIHLAFGSEADARAALRALSGARSSRSYDVRYTTREARTLTDEELATVRTGLHYSPATAPLSVGGSASSKLLDERGRTLAVVVVTWLSTDHPGKARAKRPDGSPLELYRLPVGHLKIVLKNMSNCVLSSSASLKTLGSVPVDVVPPVTWDQWFASDWPGRGEVRTADRDVPIVEGARQLLFSPESPSSALAQCRTPIAD